ncbi:MAG: hypothetical protein AAGA42_14330 [Actinomycetota bacterium]
MEPILDLTYGKGKFWNRLRELDVTRNDLHPLKGDVSEDFTATCWPDRSWPTVVFDPPYSLRGAKSDEDFEDAYGLDRYRSHAEMRESIEAGTREACRISSRWVLVKTQDQVSSYYLQSLTTWVINAALDSNARLVDSMHLLGGREQPKDRSQVRVRRGYSTMLVFKVKRPVKVKPEQLQLETSS